ncbi:MAG: hypothetical protein KIT34_01810 [Cyanobacteria bacterium TGS_CYA1]|nr:hypothetical protein [Cyanobacteria bacterium TGS_CYA1]
MSSESAQTDPYQKRLAKLAENFNALKSDDTAYDIVQKALGSKPLTMNDEWEIHEKLTAGGKDSPKYKERLKQGFIPLAINKAFAYSYLNVPLIDLIEPLIESLDFAANSIIEVVDHPARLSFVMEEVIERRMSMLLEEFGLDLVSPQELKEMISSGRKSEAEQIMSTLDVLERKVLERHLNDEGLETVPNTSIELYEKAYASALKKLRRPKTR